MLFIGLLRIVPFKVENKILVIDMFFREMTTNCILTRQNLITGREKYKSIFAEFFVHITGPLNKLFWNIVESIIENHS